MGEMADDFLINYILTFEEHVADFHNGKLDIVEAYDLGIIDEIGYEDYYSILEVKYISLNERAMYANVLLDLYYEMEV